MRNSPDYGKEMRATLDWSDADMLREMLRLRFVSGLNADLDKVDFPTVWHELCTSHYRGEELRATYLINHSLMRPRNLLKIFNHCRGFATNFNRQKIEEYDIEKGLKSYSADLLEELDRELTDVFPEARDLLLPLPRCASSSGACSPCGTFSMAPESSRFGGWKLTDFLLYYAAVACSRSCRFTAGPEISSSRSTTTSRF